MVLCGPVWCRQHRLRSGLGFLRAESYFSTLRTSATVAALMKTTMRTMCSQLVTSTATLWFRVTAGGIIIKIKAALRSPHVSSMYDDGAYYVGPDGNVSSSYVSGTNYVTWDYCGRRISQRKIQKSLSELPLQRQRRLLCELRGQGWWHRRLQRCVLGFLRECMISTEIILRLTRCHITY